jgi:hypothetical protein
MLFSH